MQTNGEEWLLKQMAGLKGVQCAFDVGANVGDWSRRCRHYFPDVAIHAFEIAPPVFAELRQKVSDLKDITLNPVGLSDQNGEMTVFYPETSHYRTTAYQEHLGTAYALPGERLSASKSLPVSVIRGDNYVSEHGVKTIDLLKIDVEGMEERVLRGFQKTFSERRIRLVQFEYNTTNIVSKFLLRDAYDFFTKMDYKVGKLYPNYVGFRDYHYRDEDFCGPNMVVVRSEDLELLKLLQP